jgi:2-iminobutanoate/2-iminopropanoate deaminase
MPTQRRDVIQTASAPAAIGPYSQAIAGQNLVFCSGQIPLDPVTGELVQGDTASQARQVMKNLEAVLIAAGTGLAQIVKTTIFLVDLADFAKVNEVYGSFFDAAPPARSTIQVAALPKGARVEIDAIALL